MKNQTTMKAICNNWRKIYKCGYCDLHYIFNYEEATYYNCGVYGWNCDIYTDYERDIAITTGYRNMRGKAIPQELIDKYTKIAKELLENRNNYLEIANAMEENKNNFLDELLKL